MPRRGRDVELLVERLEKLLADSPLEIKSPDSVIGKNSKSPREIDVSVRGKLGSSNVFIILECRKRKAKDDVTWIEQLATKREDVDANKAIAISSSGFSEGAINIAKLKGIELRLLSKLTIGDIQSWFKLEHVIEVRHTWILHHLEVILSPEDFQMLDIYKTASKQEDKQPTIVHLLHGQPKSPNEIFQHLSSNSLGIFDNLPEDGTHIKRMIEGKFVDDARYEYHYGDAQYPVEGMVFEVEMWKDTVLHPIDNIVEYKAEGGEVFAQIVEANVISSFGNLKFRADHMPESSLTHVSVEHPKEIKVSFVKVPKSAT